MSTFSLIVATTKERGIGIGGSLPWRLPKDMAFFKKTSLAVPSESCKQNVVIMGRVTWESIPTKFRPLADRFNVVISRNKDYDLQGAANTVLVDSLDAALAAVDPVKHHRVFVIGGAHIYRTALTSPQCERILLTRVHTAIECDTFFPEIPDTQFQMATHQELEDFVGSPVVQGIQSQNDIDFDFVMYTKKA
ncbi:dihydrofolate reductase [Gongronella butleri]|nr:dihydrofolate reductase [Gongronella butleri]